MLEAEFNHPNTRPESASTTSCYLPALNSFKRERATSFTDSTANGRIL
jgi:hypothetical protein